MEKISKYCRSSAYNIYFNQKVTIHVLQSFFSKIFQKDTCIALKALSEYAIVSFVGGLDLTVSLASTNFDFEKTFSLNDTNAELLNRATIPTLPTEIFVNAAGSGCALMQINVQVFSLRNKKG